MSHITDKTNAGSVSVSQYLPSSFLPSILTVLIPNLPESVADEALESLSSPYPFSGEMKDVSFPLTSLYTTGPFYLRYPKKKKIEQLLLLQFDG
jgi:hypothetical protein